MTVLFQLACINDDFINDAVEPELRITSAVESLALGDQFQFQKIYLNNIGQEEIVDAFWMSSDPSVLEITDAGLATAKAIGSVDVSVTTTVEGAQLTQTTQVAVGSETVASASSIQGTIETTTFYVLEGSFELRADEGDLILDIADNYQASSSLPGLYVYLSNNRNSIANALEISEVEVFSGAHSYTIPNTELTDYSFIVYYCKPFNVKVGEAALN